MGLLNFFTPLRPIDLRSYPFSMSSTTRFFIICIHFHALFFQCFSPIELHDIHGSSPSKALNSSEFVEIGPSIVYCLLPGREKNSGQQRCDSPRNHSELFDSFTRNSHGERGITHEALDEILAEINKTIGDFLTEKKVGEI